MSNDNVQCPSAPYNTISAAVVDADPGDTIMVCAGPYPELVVVDKTLTFLGPQQNVDGRTRAVPATSEAIVGAPDGAFQIEADNVVINGFTIEGVVANPSAPPFTGLGAGIWTNPGFSGTDGGHQILYNIIQLNIVGIYLNNSCTFSTLVRFNAIRNNTLPGPASGTGIYSDGYGLCNAQIDRNKFSGNTTGSVSVFGPPFSGVASDIDVTANELVAGTPESISFLGVSSSSIIGNISTGSTNDSTITLQGNNSGVVVSSNTLTNGLRAIFVNDQFLQGINTNITAHQNCIKGNSIAGMQVDPLGYPVTPQLNAENNWWGHPSGPNEIPRNTGGMGDKIIDLEQNVDFDPWLIASPGAPCPAFVPPPNTPGKVTGGGWIQSPDGGGGGGGIAGAVDVLQELATVLITKSSKPTSVNGKATFGFTVTCCPPKGNLEYNDHAGNVRIKGTSMSTLVISNSTVCPPGGKHAQFKGQANETTETGTHPTSFTVDVDDCDEPGSSPGAGPDTFKIHTDDYDAEGPLVGGNIQVHKS